MIPSNNSIRFLPSESVQNNQLVLAAVKIHSIRSHRLLLTKRWTSVRVMLRQSNHKLSHFRVKMKPGRVSLQIFA